MNALLKDFPMSEFGVVGFPCNQFGRQEPGDNEEEILNVLKYVRPGNLFQPHPRLHLMLKTDVNGPEQNPLFSYLKESCPQPRHGRFYPKDCFWDPIYADDVIWNFEKFLVSSEGIPLYRFRPEVNPFDIKTIIRALANRLTNPREQEEKLRQLLENLDSAMIGREH